MYDYLPPKCHQPVKVSLTLELYQVCIFDDAEDIVLILLWQEENTEVVLFVWDFFLHIMNLITASVTSSLSSRERNCQL